MQASADRFGAQQRGCIARVRGPGPAAPAGASAALQHRAAATGRARTNRRSAALHWASAGRKARTAAAAAGRTVSQRARHAKEAAAPAGSRRRGTSPSPGVSRRSQRVPPRLWRNAYKREQHRSEQLQWQVQARPPRHRQATPIQQTLAPAGSSAAGAAPGLGGGGIRPSRGGMRAGSPHYQHQFRTAKQRSPARSAATHPGAGCGHRPSAPQGDAPDQHARHSGAGWRPSSRENRSWRDAQAPPEVAAAAFAEGLHTNRSARLGGTEAAGVGKARRPGRLRATSAGKGPTAPSTRRGELPPPSFRAAGGQQGRAIAAAPPHRGAGRIRTVGGFPPRAASGSRSPGGPAARPGHQTAWGPWPAGAAAPPAPTLIDAGNWRQSVRAANLVCFQARRCSALIPRAWSRRTEVPQSHLREDTQNGGGRAEPHRIGEAGLGWRPPPSSRAHEQRRASAKPSSPSCPAATS